MAQVLLANLLLLGLLLELLLGLLLLELLLRLLELSLELLLGLLPALEELLLGRLLLELLLLHRLPPPRVEVCWPLRPLLLRRLGLELGSLLLSELLLGLPELLLLLGLPLLEGVLLLGELAGVEPVEGGGGLAPGHLLHPLPGLLLLPGPQRLLLPPPLGLLGQPRLLGSLALPSQLVADDLGQGLEVEAEEHVEGVLLSVLGQVGELVLAELLQLGGQGQVLPVELLLLLPGEPLPGGGVGEGCEAELLVLQLLGDGQPLPGGQLWRGQLRGGHLGHPAQQLPPHLRTQPLRHCGWVYRRGWGCCSCCRCSSSSSSRSSSSCCCCGGCCCSYCSCRECCCGCKMVRYEWWCSESQGREMQQYGGLDQFSIRYNYPDKCLSSDILIIFRVPGILCQYC